MAGARNEPRTLVVQLERAARLSPNSRERFAGWGVMGQTFASGHVLAMRRYTASSLGPGYSAVWHRDPGGAWTFYSSLDPALSCARHFSAALRGAATTPISLAWVAERRLYVSVPEARLRWSIELEPTWRSRVITAIAHRVPERFWERPAIRRLAEPLAGRFMRVGCLRFGGRVPNGQAFLTVLQRIWMIGRTTASLAGEDLGSPGPLAVQAALGDFCIPQRGVFAIGQSSFDRHDPALHAPLPAASMASRASGPTPALDAFTPGTGSPPSRR